MLLNKRLLAALLIAAAQSGFSQNTTIHESVLGVRYLLRSRLNERWSVQAEAEDRRFFLPKNGQNLFVGNAHLHRRLGGRSELVLGAAVAEIASQNPEKPASKLTELRPWQGFGADLAVWGKWRFSHRLRVEERFFRQKGAATTFALRERCLVQARRPVGKKLDAFAGDEVFLQQGRQIERLFDQNRLTAGTDWKFSKRFDLELAYTWWWQLRSTGSTVYDRNFIRLTLGQKIGR